MKRVLTTEEQLIEVQYKLKQFTTLLQLVGKEIGQDKIIDIARSSDYPKTDEEVKKMIEQGRLLKDLDRYELLDEGLEICNSGGWVLWEDVEKIIKG